MALIFSTCHVDILLGQTTDVYGVVTDSLTKQRVPFVNVSVVGTNWGASGNNLGFYFISKLPPGTYEISASSIGYVKASRTVVLRDIKSFELNFQLPPVPIESQEVLVTAPRKKLDLETKKTSVHVLERHELKLVPVAGQQDLLQSLKILPGIVSTSDVSSRFYVRGGAGDQNLFLFDGIRIYYPFHALGIYSVFSPEMVDNVEVYTGAFPPGFGGKLSSVVNITARDGRADRIAARANVNFLSSEFSIEGPAISKTSFIINARKSISSKTFGDVLGQNVPLDFYDATVKLSTQPGGVQKFDITFLTSGDKLKSRSPLEPEYSWRNNGLAFSGSGLPSAKMFVNWLIYMSSYTASRSSTATGSVTSATTSVKEQGLRVNATVYTGPEDLYYFGFDFGFPTLDYTFVNRLGLNQIIQSSLLDVSAWIRYQTTLGPLQVDGGFHLEVGALFDGSPPEREIQPRLNASYLLAGTWRAKGSIGRFTQRMLTVGNEDDVISIFDAWIRVPKELPTEQADHYVIGISGSLTEQATINAEAYYKDYNSLVVYNRDKIEATDPDYIKGSGQSYGAEVTIRSHSSFVDLYAVYSLSWAKIDNGGLIYYPRYDRRHHINLMAITHPLKGLTATARWEFGSGFPFSQTVGYFDRLTLDNALPGQFELETGSPFIILGSKNAARLPAYHRMDINIAYTFNLLGLDCSVGADLLNVYNSKNIFYFDRKTGERVNMLSFFPSATVTVAF
ncbi:MAG: TonB-dependent receptor [Ignavibacteria bacterium]|nr:TonB-dependent receptor [Ignavibacteria bacterium]